MKTVVYIDGFNLYYGAISNTPYKWLDVVKLFTRISKEKEPETEIITIKYFTAPVLGKVARSGLKAMESQNMYHKALRNLYPKTLQIIQGYFQVEERDMPKFRNPIDKDKTVKVWKIEEKKTDVNIALEMLLDAQEGIEQVVLVSNDTDLLPAILKIRKHKPDVKIAVIIPKKENLKNTLRPANKELINNADWFISHIKTDYLIQSQLPKTVPTKKKPAFRPKYW